MREALTDFIQEVRAAGVPISVAESADALRAASSVSFDRETLREALAASLVKDEADRAAFDETFERFFSAGDEAAGRRRARRVGAEVGIGGARGEGGSGGRPPRESEPAPAGEPRRAAPSDRRQPQTKDPRTERAEDREARAEVRRRRRGRELLRKPFRDLDPLEAEELAEFAAEIARRFRARLRRRFRIGGRERLDFRRTLRRSIARGGAPFDLAFRRRRPGRPDLVALCDVSGSVRHASELFAALLRPCEGLFRRVRIVVFVDRPVEATFEAGRLAPHEPVDFHAFSDFGRVLAELGERFVESLGRNTVLLVLGDARNNRRPPRADLFSRLRPRVKTLLWLDPERRALWATGDAAIAAYAPHCDAVLECATGAELVAALSRLPT